MPFRLPFRPRLASARFVALVYTILTAGMTWPLMRGLTRDLPADLGDSVLNTWILGWHAQHLLRAPGGDLSALRDVWNANIFYPSPLALAYSEHLFAQTVQILPVYVLTDNLVLCYNLLFLSSFVLSAFGTYLFVREVTGNPLAAFVAGLVYGFLPYRVAQLPHMQILSSQWMPFVLYGLRRFLDGGGRWALAGAGLAWLAQNLSCGYYLLFFSPFVGFYALYEMTSRGRLREGRTWMALLLMAAGVMAATWPFLRPYQELRARGMFEPRNIREVQGYSADVFGYLFAAPDLKLWGDRLAVFGRAEGEVFPGFVAMTLAAIGIAMASRRAWQQARPAAEQHSLTRPLPHERGRGAREHAWAPWWIRVRGSMMAFIAIFAAYHLLVALLTLATGGFEWGFLTFRWERLPRLWRRVLGSSVILIALWPRGRLAVWALFRSLPGFSAVALLLAFWLSLGPRPTAMGEEIRLFGLYQWLYDYVPGFDGLRVPARYAMLVGLFLAVLAGYGTAELTRRKRGALLVSIFSLLLLVEVTAAPIRINDVEFRNDFLTPPNRLLTGADIPPVYRFLATLPKDSVIVELPFGVWIWDLQYMYYSTVHLKPLVNGYSGWFPPGFDRAKRPIGRIDRQRTRGWRAIMASGATHVVLHEGSFLKGGNSVIDMLERRGAREIARFGTDYVYELPAVRRQR